MRRSLLCCVFLAAPADVCYLACEEVSAADRLTPAPFRAGRSVTLATHGMVATSHPLAAQIGLDVLKAGGNAVDAAIAVNAALGLMEPMSCGIGGDLYAIVWDSKTGRLHGLNASGRAPLKASRAWFAEKGYREIPTIGPLSWSVPGCVDGWSELHKRFGKAPFASLLEPSHPLRRGRLPGHRGDRGLLAQVRGAPEGDARRRSHLPQSTAGRPGPASCSRTRPWLAPIG